MEAGTTITERKAGEDLGGSIEGGRRQGGVCGIGLLPTGFFYPCFLGIQAIYPVLEARALPQAKGP